MFCNMLRALEIIFLFKFLNVFGNPVPFNCTTNVGNCTNNNELCEFIPLPHILCKFKKVKENCPRTCNSCPEALEPDQVSYRHDQNSVYNKTDSEPLDEKNQFYNDSSSNKVDYTVYKNLSIYCSLEKIEGACLDVGADIWISHYTRWYYDSGVGECKEFVYTGCGGNRNNFESRDLCMSACSEEINNGTYPEMEDNNRRYVKALVNTNCPSNRLVLTVDECKMAASQVGITYGGASRRKDRPAGCYWSGINVRSYFNRISDPSATSPSNSGGICKSKECFNNRNDTDCIEWKENGYCTRPTTNKYEYGEVWMKENCYKTCGYCGEHDGSVNSSGEGYDSNDYLTNTTAMAPTTTLRPTPSSPIVKRLTEKNGWTFYKIKVTGKMTREIVPETCDKFGLYTPCYSHNSGSAQNGPKCKVTHKTTDIGAQLAKWICNASSNKCPDLHGVFMYMLNWNDNSACGITSGGHCKVGKDFADQWVLCANED